MINSTKISVIIKNVINFCHSITSSTFLLSLSLISILNDKKDEASDIVQIIGNIGITGNYQKIANQEMKSANRWRNIALFLMILMVLAIGATILFGVKNGFDWKMSLFRVLASLVLSIPATYAAKESSKHRKIENYNRKTELELASLEPFMEKLPEEAKITIREKLTEKYFGQETKEEKHEEPITTNSLIELIKIALKAK